MSLSGAGNRVGSIKLLIGEKVRREKLWTSAGATPLLSGLRPIPARPDLR
jgi:hypothetical protein